MEQPQQQGFTLPQSFAEKVRWIRSLEKLDPIVQGFVQEACSVKWLDYTLLHPNGRPDSFSDVWKWMTTLGARLDHSLWMQSFSWNLYGEAIWFGIKGTRVIPGDVRPLQFWDYGSTMELEDIEIRYPMVGWPGKWLYAVPNQDVMEALQAATFNPALRLAPGVAEAWAAKQPIPLGVDAMTVGPHGDDETSVISHLVRLSNPSATRGTAPLGSCLHVCAADDKVRDPESGADEAAKEHFRQEKIEALEKTFQLKADFTKGSTSPLFTPTRCFLEHKEAERDSLRKWAEGIWLGRLSEWNKLKLGEAPELKWTLDLSKVEALPNALA